MKIAHLIAGAHQGGAELFYERLCIAQAKAGDQILPLIRKDPARAKRLADAGLSPQQFRFGNWPDFYTRPRLARAMHHFAPSVAVAWMGRAARHAPAGPWVLIGRLGGYYDLKQFAHCDHLVGNTQGMVDWILRQGWPPERVRKLPNFTPDLAGATPAILPTPPGAKTVLAMGRLHPNKGFDVLIAALPKLPGVHAIIAGEGEQQSLLRDLAQSAGVADRAHFLGWRPDTAAILAACDLLVCPSRSEPLGNVILEAFSARCPVVAAMAEGPRALIDTGRTGILVPIDSAIALAAGIEAVLANPTMAAAIAAAGRQCYEANYTESAVVAQWRDYLTNLAKP